MLLLAHPVAAQIVAPPQRLLDLRAAYQKAIQAEVGAAHEASVADLNAKFSAALDRAVLTATQSGDLDAALALRDEKKRVADSLPLPADDKDAPPVLQPLRLTYRQAIANLEVTKNQRLAPLRQKFDQALAALFADLTKAGDLDGALAVKAERESLLAAAGTATPALVASNASTPIPAKPAVSMKYDPAAAQAIIDWVHLGKGEVATSTDGGRTRQGFWADQADKMPKSRFELVSVRHGGAGTIMINPPFPWEKLPQVPTLTFFEMQQRDPITAEQLGHLGSIIQNLTFLNLGPNKILPEDWPALPPAPKLKELILGVPGRPLNVVDERLLDLLAERYPALEVLGIAWRFRVTARSIPTLARWRYLRRLYITGTLDSEVLSAIGKFNELYHLAVEHRDSTIDPEALAGLKNITFIKLDACTDAAIMALPAMARMSSLNGFDLRGMSLPADALTPFKGHKKLERVFIPGFKAFDDAALASLLTAEKLVEIDMRDTAITDAGLRQLHDAKRLQLVKFAGTKVTPAAIAALRSALPKCRIYEK